MKFRLCGQTPKVGSKHCVDYDVDEEDIRIHLGLEDDEEINPERALDAVSDFVVDQGDQLRVVEWNVEIVKGTP